MSGSRPRSRPRKRHASLAAAGLLALAACRARPVEEIESSDKVPVVTKTAWRGAIRTVAGATGLVRPAPGAEQIVTAPQPARILEMPKAEGDPVRRGDLLVSFEIPSLEADAAGRRSDLARAEARLESVRAASVRVEGLFERGIAARRDVEDAKRELAEAEAGLTEAKSATSAASLLQGRQTIRARFDGIVASRWPNPGDLVDPSSGEPILRVIDPTRLQVEASVPLAELPMIKVGGAARILGPEGTPAEEATVVSRPAAVDPATGSAPVRLAFRRPTKLPSGAPIVVEILGEEHPDAVLVPAAALVHEGDETFVYILEGEETVRRRKVAVGIAAGATAEILSGIAAGDRVVVQGQDSLPDGATVVASP